MVFSLYFLPILEYFVFFGYPYMDLLLLDFNVNNYLLFPLCIFNYLPLLAPTT